MAVWRTTRSIPADLARPFAISIIAADADKHDVPLVISEFKRPAFSMFVKKRANITRKKKKEIAKRNFAKLFVKASSSLYLEKNFELITSETDISGPLLLCLDEVYIF